MDVETQDFVAEWAGRQRYWARKLGRLKLGVEPLSDQLTRYHRATLTLSVVVGALAVMFVGLFAAFGKPAIGAVVAAVLLGPIVGFAWIDQKRLERLAARYEGERRAFKAKTSDQAQTSSSSTSS